METKICSKCGVYKPVKEFSKCSRIKSGLKSQCKGCISIAGKKYRANPEVKKVNKIRVQNWVKENKEKRTTYISNYYEDNKEERLKYSKKFYKDNREKYKKMRKKYYYKNKDTIYEQIKYKRKTDIIYKLKHTVGGIIRQSIKRGGYDKKSRSHEILGCTYKEFKKHIESQWEPWMNWDNHGLYNYQYNFGWDLDHIIPLASATCKEDIIKLNHYTNFQPLCSYVNRNEKRANY